MKYIYYDPGYAVPILIQEKAKLNRRKLCDFSNFQQNIRKTFFQAARQRRVSLWLKLRSQAKSFYYELISCK